MGTAGAQASWWAAFAASPRFDTPAPTPPGRGDPLRLLCGPTARALAPTSALHSPLPGHGLDAWPTWRCWPWPGSALCCLFFRGPPPRSCWAWAGACGASSAAGAECAGGAGGQAAGLLTLSRMATRCGGCPAAAPFAEAQQRGPCAHARHPTLSALAELIRTWWHGLARSRQRFAPGTWSRPHTSLGALCAGGGPTRWAMPSAHGDERPNLSEETGRPAAAVWCCTPRSPARRVARSGAIARGIKRQAFIRRHPHVFAGRRGGDTAVRASWGGDQGEEAQRQGSSHASATASHSDSASPAKCAANPPWLRQ